MASTATTYIQAINVAFPVAGEDNDSQGFRDNYANIKNSLTALKNEVDGIQTGGAFTDQTNDFQQNIIQNAQLQSVGYVISKHQVGAIGGDQVIDFAEGNYQVWKITSATNFTFANFPDITTHAPLQLELYKDADNTATSVAVVLVASTTTDILYDTNPNTQVTNPIYLTTASSVVYEIARTVNNLNSNPDAYRVRFLGGPFEA